MNPEPLINSSTNHSPMDLVFKTRKKNRKCIRLQKEKIDILKVYFQKCPYPKKDQYELYSQAIDETPAKVENWFKYQRRTYKSTGVIKEFKERKILCKEKEKVLEEAFRVCIKPHPDRYKQLAKMLECEVKPIKKWFSYRRRKLTQIQKSKKKSKNFSDFSSKSNSNSDSQKLSNDSPIKKENRNDSSNENSYLINYDNNNTKNTNIKATNEIKKEFKLMLKNECHGENSSVFYTSNDSHSNSQGKKAASNFNISNLNENNSNSNDQNHDLPSSSNDSNSNSNDQLNDNQNHSNSIRGSGSNKISHSNSIRGSGSNKISNSNSNRGSGSNKMSNSNNGDSSQFKTNSSSNVNYNNSKAETNHDTRDTRSKNHEIRHKKIMKYNKKGQLKKKCDLIHSRENDESNNSSKEDCYNLNYFINSYNQKTPGQTMIQAKNENPAFNNPYSNNLSESFLKNNNFDKNPSEIDYRPQNQNLNNNMNPNYMNYTQNIQNYPICFPIQMNQSYNQMPFNYMDNNKSQAKSAAAVPVIYQYGGNMNNTQNFPQIRNNNMFLAQPQSQNLNQNYEIVPNYVTIQNPNNSFQIVQMGMALRPVSNVLVIPQERLQQIQRSNNNIQYPSYVICPMNNSMQSQNGEENGRIKEQTFN